VDEHGWLDRLEGQRNRDSRSPAGGRWDDPWGTLGRDGFSLAGESRFGVALMVEGQRLDAQVRFAHGLPHISVAGGPEVTLGDEPFVAPTWPGALYANLEPEPEGSLPPDIRVKYRGDHHPHEVAFVLTGGRQTRVEFYDPFTVDLEHMDEGGSVKAPMHGKLVALFVKPGDRVEKGQRLAVVEAMKMEHALVAPSDGEVAEVTAEPGSQVAEGARLIVLKTET
jgi:3-methylcrotonyl-CoA carboxylase alpha subunit